MRKSSSTPRAFTLVELILVMTLLAVIMAIAAPTLGRSMRGRGLEQEAERFLALTEYARNEAISQGASMAVWIDPASGRFGMESRGGEVASGREREFVVNPEVRFEVTNAVTTRGVAQAAEFAPDGTPSINNVATVRLIDRFQAVATIARTSDGWGYELLKEAK